MPAQLIDLSRLTTADKLRLIEEVWDDLCQSPADVPIPDWHKDEIDRRLAAAKVHPEDCESWEVVRERLRRSND